MTECGRRESSLRGRALGVQALTKEGRNEQWTAEREEGRIRLQGVQKKEKEGWHGPAREWHPPEGKSRDTDGTNMYGRD